MGRPKPGHAGYKLERIYVVEQGYHLRDAASVEASQSAAEREVSFGWDWRPLGPLRFEVVIDIDLHPTKDAPEDVNVRLLGVFSARQPEELSIPFTEFVRYNAPAILFPYAREVLSTMTGRGPFGAFHVDPVNVRILAGDMDVTQTTGYRFLVEHPDTAATFGLPYTPTPVPAQLGSGTPGGD